MHISEAQRAPAETGAQKKQALGMLVVAVVITLFTYQVFHHGLWGKLVSYGKKPDLVLTGTAVTPRTLKLAVYNTGGPGTYGEFTTRVTIAAHGRPIDVWTSHQLALTPAASIQNYYPFQKISAGPNGLIVPLAAKGIVSLPLRLHTGEVLRPKETVTVTVEDVSGLTWTIPETVRP